MTPAALVWCPFGDEDSAAAIARTLLDEGHVACANILPHARSLFMWQGRFDEVDETVVVFKTTSDRLDAAISRLAELHPYDTPAIAGWRADVTPPETARWLGSVVGDSGR